MEFPNADREQISSTPSIKRTYQRPPRNGNKDKRLGIEIKKKKVKDSIKPCLQKNIMNLNIDELKKLCKKRGFAEDGTKKKLMTRLMKPMDTINEMKLKFHI